MKKLLAVFVVAVFCSAIGGFFWNSSKAQVLKVDSSINPLRNESFNRLINQSRQTGAVRVIVGLNTNFRVEGDLSRTAVERQRENIKQAQNEFLNNLASRTTLNGLTQFETIPFLAFETDAATLERLQNDNRISSIEEDVLDAPTLAQSTVVVGATTAWTNGYSGSGQTIAILDTGVNKNHQFLTGKVVSEACYSSTIAGSNAASVCPGGVTDSTASDSGLNCDTAVTGCAHGTHVAGIAAGRGTTFSGVAKDANLIAIQVFSRVDNATSCGSNPSPCALSYTSDQIKGLERVLALSSSLTISSVNMSLGGGQYFANCDAAQASRKAAIDNLRSVGIATTISSGNSGYTDSMGAPACISSAVSVGSTGDGSSGATLDVVSSFSNSVSFLNLLAPGQWINSSVANGASTTTYQNYSGTSMAAPHVAGAWAILKQRSPNASVTQILNALTTTGLPITDTRNSVIKPRIRIAEALNALSGPTSGKQFDFDGDSKADVSTFRSSNGIWYINQSQNGFTGIQFGASGDIITPADYDGDGKTDVAVFRSGTWYLQRSTAGFTGISFGTTGDIPVPADYDGDGKADVAVFRPSTGAWYLQRSTAGFTGVSFGQNGDKPVAADYDGDGKADVAVFRSGTWYLQRSTAGFTGVAFGDANDKLVPADYDGDGKADVAVFRPSTGAWYLQRSTAGFTGVSFGTSTDLPTPADYDGDGKTDVAVFRSGTWYLQRSTAGFTGVSFGASTDTPIPNAYVR